VRGRPGTWVRIATALGASLLLVLLIPAAPSSSAAGAGPTPIPLPASATHCSGSAIATSLAGTLSIQGGPTPLPSVAGQTVWLTYYDELNFTPSGSSSVYSCQLRTASATTDTLGGFSIAASVPSSGCIPGSCSYYAGPYAPATFSILNGTPGGYFLTQTLSGSTVGLDLVYGLTAIALSPTSRVTLSINAPTPIKASPLAANNAPSPATVTFAWRISGSGWGFVGPSNVANATIEASFNALPGTLTVWANGTYNGTSMDAAPASLLLAAAATGVDGGDVTPTTLDAGYDATFTVTGVGAANYAYVAAITPGLGLPQANASCTYAIVAGGLWDLTCSVSVVYPSAGASVPSAVLTNGFSSAPWTFPPIAVAEPVGLSLAPGHLVAYTLSPQSVRLTVPTMTGVQPYGDACLWPGDGTLQCLAGPGPTYPFTVVYGHPGAYTGRVSLEDATGANVSAPFTASVYDPMAPLTVIASANAVNVTGHVALTTSVSGGASPIAYWWNTTRPGGTVLEGSLVADGSLVLDFSPHVSGLTNVTLTLVDALGTRENTSAQIFVANGPPAAIAEAVPSNWTAIAGSPFPIDWRAVDPAGEPVGSYSASTWVRVTPAILGTVLPFVSVVPVVGAATSSVNGTFVLNASCWRGASLNFSLIVDGAGVFTVTAGSGLPVLDTQGGGRLLLVGPDLGSLKATAQFVAVAGVRTNHTLYNVHDRFGDALTGGELLVHSDFGSESSNWLTPVLTDASGSQVWVNFSAPGDLAGTVALLVPGGVSFLTVQVPASPAPSAPSSTWLLVLAGLGVVGALAGAVVVGRRRRDTDPSPTAIRAPDTEADLRRLAEGRAHVLGRADPWIGRTLDELALGFVGRPPTPEEVTEWVASLVADGSLRTVLGEDGRSRFLRVEPEEPEPVPKVELDPAALDAALERRAEDADGPDRS
jgi:hypothetical protein